MEDAERRIRALREEADRLEKEKRLVDSLPRCPFCGGKPRILEIRPAWGSMNFGGDSDFSVACEGCGCGTKDYKDKESAVRSWSRRVNVRATLRVVNANDLTPRFQCWVE